jgi:dihydrofolate synthase/folylpolyglutamate synthase
VTEPEYLETVRFLFGLTPRGIRLELDRMRAACALAGDPQRGLALVHVAGTNGKGSTSAMIERIAREAGLSTGLYTSPHLHSFAERIRVNGVPIPREEIVARVGSLRGLLASAGAPELTFFELTTLLAFQAFAARGLDLVVLEVGLGGRLDATNVIETPLASVITHIDLDHQQYLGSTLPEIAAEKAGIVKTRVPVLHAADAPGELRDPSARAVIDARASTLGAPSFALGRELALVHEDDASLSVSLGESRVTGLRPRLLGAHQAQNVALAVGAALTVGARLGRSIDAEAMRRGVAEVGWAGRLERLELPAQSAPRDGAQRFLVDAAHNPDGARALAAFLASEPQALRPNGRDVLVFGAMADKAWREMLAILGPVVSTIVCVAPPLARAERPEVLAAASGGEAAESVIAGLERARALAGPEGRVIVCGSIFVLAEARAHLLGIEQEPLVAM